LLLATGEFLSLEATVLFEAFAELDPASHRVSELVDHRGLELLDSQIPSLQEGLLVALDVVSKRFALVGCPSPHHGEVEPVPKRGSGLLDDLLGLVIELLKRKDFL